MKPENTKFIPSKKEILKKTAKIGDSKEAIEARISINREALLRLQTQLKKQFEDFKYKNPKISPEKFLKRVARRMNYGSYKVRIQKITELFYGTTKDPFASEEKITTPQNSQILPKSINKTRNEESSENSLSSLKKMEEDISKGTLIFFPENLLQKNQGVTAKMVKEYAKFSKEWEGIKIPEGKKAMNAQDFVREAYNKSSVHEEFLEQMIILSEAYPGNFSAEKICQIAFNFLKNQTGTPYQNLPEILKKGLKKIILGE